MGFTADMPVRFLHFEGCKVDDDAVFQSLTEIIKDKKPVLVIFDSLIRIHGEGENGAKAMAKVMGRLRSIVNLGTAVLVIHHNEGQ